MFWNRYSIENVSSESHQNFAPDPRWAVGGSLVRCATLVVKSSAVPSEPAAPIGAHWSGGGRGQQEGMGGMNLGFSELYAHWAIWSHGTICAPRDIALMDCFGRLGSAHRLAAARLGCGSGGGGGVIFGVEFKGLPGGWRSPRDAQ